MDPKPLSSRTCFLLILLFGIGTYANALTGSFQFDDVPAILENRALYPLDIGRLWHYHPHRFITNLSFVFNIYFAGFQTWSFHILNLLIHLAASWVTFRLTLSILQTPAMKDRIPHAQPELFALVAALLFAVHPIQTQAVTYIVQRAASLATLFYLATLWMYLKARLENARYYWHVSFLMLAAMLTKEISFTLPFAILLTELCFFPVTPTEPLHKKLLRWTPFAAFLLVIPLLYLINTHLLAAGGSLKGLPTLIQGLSRWDYLMTQFRVERTYLRLLFLPIHQCLAYDYRISRGLEDLDSWAAFSLLLSLLSLAVVFFKKNRLLSFGILWFFLTLSVESSIIPLSDMIFEHRLYLPMFGFALCLTSLLRALFRPIKGFVAVSLPIILIFSGMTYARNKVWQSPLTLWQDVIKKSPRKWLGYCYLGLIYTNEFKDPKTALSYFHKALEAGSYTSDLLLNMSTVYFRLGDSQKGTYYHQRALDLANFESPYWGNALDHNQVVFLKNENKKLAAIDALKKAVETDAPSSSFHVQLGNLYSETGQEENAILSFRKAIEIAPLSKQGYNALASLYTRKGNKTKALAVIVEYLKQKKRHRPLFGNDLELE